jgi:hypothetical protein
MLLGKEKKRVGQGVRRIRRSRHGSPGKKFDLTPKGTICLAGSSKASFVP